MRSMRISGCIVFVAFVAGCQLVELATTWSDASPSGKLYAQEENSSGADEELPPPAPENEATAAPPRNAPQGAAAGSVLLPPDSSPGPALTPPSLPEAIGADTRAGDLSGEPRAYLGLIGDIDAGGVRVLSVHEGGPAAQAGFRENDLISAVEDQPIRSLDDMTGAITSRKAGDEVQFTVRRGDREMKLQVTLGAMAEERPAPAQSLPTPAAQPTTARPKLGIHVSTVTDDLRRRYGVEFPQGALVTAVQAGSVADRAGLPAGAVITALDGQPVVREQDVVNYIASARWGQSLDLAYHYNGQELQKTIRLPASSEESLSAAEDSDPRRPRAIGRRLLLPGGVVAEGPALDRIERMIEAFAGPYAPLERRLPAGDASSAPSELESLRGELDRLQRRITELEDELAAERAAKSQP